MHALNGVQLTEGLWSGDHARDRPPAKPICVATGP